MTVFVSITGALAVLVAIGTLVWVVVRQQKRIGELELQLFQAWKDDYRIPPAPSSLPEPEPDDPPLPSELTTIVNDWESPETRASLADAFRASLRQGYSPRAVMHRYMEGLYGGLSSPE